MFKVHGPAWLARGHFAHALMGATYLLVHIARYVNRCMLKKKVGGTALGQDDCT